jgi:hypothetical protein
MYVHDIKVSSEREIRHMLFELKPAFIFSFPFIHHHTT